MGDGAVCGGDLQCRGSSSLGRHCGFPIGMKYAWIWLQFSVKETTISATIGPRLWVNRDPGSPSIIVLIDWRQFRMISSTIVARSRSDRGSIGLRSWSSSTCLRSRPIALQVSGWSRSRDRVDQDCEERPPSDGRRSR